MSDTGRTTDLTLLIVAGAITISLSVASFLIAPADTSPAVDGSSFANHPAGARGTFLSLKAARYDIRQSYEPITALRSTPSETVLVIADPAREPSQGDLRALVRFVEAGGIVLGTGTGARAFLQGLPAASADSDDAEATIVNAAVPSWLSRGVPDVSMTPASSPLARESPYLIVYGTDARPAILAARFGSGHAIWWAGSTPLTNAGISAPGHVELLVNVLGSPGERSVLWDEHYHGHTRSLWSYVAATPMAYAAAQLAFVFVAGLLTFSRRRWPIRAQHVEPRTSPLEFVDSMGTLYQRANAAMGAVVTVRTRVRRALTGSCGLPLTVPDEQLSEAAAERAGTTASALNSILASSGEAASNPGLKTSEARAAVAALQRLAVSLKTARRKNA